MFTVFWQQSIKTCSLRSYLTNWCKKMHFLKEPLYNGRKHSDTWSVDFDALFSYWSILLFVLILIVRRVKSELLICFASEFACHSVMCSGESGEGPPLIFRLNWRGKKNFETGPLPPLPYVKDWIRHWCDILSLYEGFDGNWGYQIRRNCMRILGVRKNYKFDND